MFRTIRKRPSGQRSSVEKKQHEDQPKDQETEGETSDGSSASDEGTTTAKAIRTRRRKRNWSRSLLEKTAACKGTKCHFLDNQIAGAHWPWKLDILSAPNASRVCRVPRAVRALSLV